MRYKFRGKVKNENGLYLMPDGTWIIGESYERKKSVVDGEYKVLINGYEVDPETVGQYTNYYGLEFCDGDVIAIACDCDSEYGCSHGDEIYTIVWDKETAGYALMSNSNGKLYSLDDYGVENMRVIGNIHDHPHLIGGDKG